jgi:16S rRNA (uracil1498-N3)-methyltransferase
MLSRAAFQIANDGRGLLLSEMVESTPMRAVLEPLVAAPTSAAQDAIHLALAVGPEGGWTDEEFAVARAANFAEVALGKNIMRTETAVCAALAAVQYAFGGFAQTADAAGVAASRAGEIA